MGIMLGRIDAGRCERIGMGIKGPQYLPFWCHPYVPGSPIAKPVFAVAAVGNAVGMKVSDLAAIPIAAGAALRHRRLFHPIGIAARGAIERLAPPRHGLPVSGAQIVARVSKAIGAPGALPDAAGLAWRTPPAAFTPTPWDVLLVTAGLGDGSLTADRMLLRPVLSWSSAVFSSLLPLEYDDGDHRSLWWVRARLITGIDGPGLSLNAIADHIRSEGVSFEVEQACGTGEFEPLARITLDELMPDGEDVSFDPVAHTLPGVRVWPGWLRDLRALAYRSSRVGRHAG